jgi:hypothetical protein
MMPSVQCTGPGEEGMVDLICSMLLLFPLSTHLIGPLPVDNEYATGGTRSSCGCVAGTLAFKPAEGTALGEIFSDLIASSDPLGSRDRLTIQLYPSSTVSAYNGTTATLYILYQYPC